MAFKTVLVTGGNRGIGKAICQLLLEKHPDVQVLLASRDLDRGNKAAQDLKNHLGSACEGRLEVVEMDTSSDESVSKAAAEIAAKHPTLYGIVNNAGVWLETPYKNTMNTNYFGPRRVNDALSKLLKRPGGRIVNIASASGPVWVSRDKNERSKLSQPWLIQGGIPELDDMARKIELTSDVYGISKAFLSAYTSLHARSEPDLIINSVTPGFIASDMGKAIGATKPVAFGAIPPVYLLLSSDMETIPTGRFYGSDSKRSPLDEYRGPGDPVYEGPDWM
jgi:NAD(P)-dependent dehydrogenase (short-subunit alcohol dehydrogenase family)